MFEKRNKIWESLGVDIKNCITPESALKVAKLDYEVALAPMYANFIPSGTLEVHKIEHTNEVGFPSTYYECLNQDGHILQIPKKGELVKSVFATYRTDNYRILGTVGKRYEPVQNSVALEFIYKVCKENGIYDASAITIEKAGILSYGARIFVIAKLPEYNIRDDVYEKYILFTTSHDGSSSITACFTDIRMYCSNMLNYIINQAVNKFTFKHTKNVLSNLESAAELMNESLHYSKSISQALEQSMDIEVTSEYAIDYIFELLFNKNQIDYIKDKGGIQNISQGDTVISTKKLNQFIEIVNYINKGVGQDKYVNSLYWLYNGVTSWLNNSISYKSEEDRFDNLTTGWAYKFGQNAFDSLINRIQ